MRVEKFRTFEEARRALWRKPGDPILLECMKQMGELAKPPEEPHGVRRFRTIEEAKA